MEAGEPLKLRYSLRKSREPEPPARFTVKKPDDGTGGSPKKVRAMRAFALFFLTCALGCATLPELPPVHETAPEDDPAEESTRVRYDVSDIVDILAQQGWKGSELCDEVFPPILVALCKLLNSILDKAVYGGISGAVGSMKKELIVEGSPSVHELMKDAVHYLKGRPDAPCRVQVQTVRFDPRSLRSWQVLFRPITLLKDGKGEGLFSVVSGLDFDKWMAAARKAKMARYSIRSKLSLQQLKPSTSFPACQLSFVSHYEEKPGKELDPVMGLMAFGMSLSLRGLRVPSANAIAVEFNAEITHSPGGMRGFSLELGRVWQHLLNVSRIRFKGTARIPDGSCLIVMTAPFCWDASDLNPDWPVMIVMKSS